MTGTVVAKKMQKTVVVEMHRKMKHPTFHKVIIRSRRMKVHCEDEQVHVGDMISFSEVRPISKQVNYTLVAKIQK